MHFKHAKSHDRYIHIRDFSFFQNVVAELTTAKIIIFLTQELFF